MFLFFEETQLTQDLRILRNPDSGTYIITVVSVWMLREICDLACHPRIVWNVWFRTHPATLPLCPSLLFFSNNYPTFLSGNEPHNGGKSTSQDSITYLAFSDWPTTVSRTSPIQNGGQLHGAFRHLSCLTSVSHSQHCSRFTNTSSAIQESQDSASCSKLVSATACSWSGLLLIFHAVEKHQP